MKKRKNAFTLVDGLIAIAIIGFISVILIPTIVVNTKKKERAAIKRVFIADLSDSLRYYLTKNDTLEKVNNASGFLGVIGAQGCNDCWLSGNVYTSNYKSARFSMPNSVSNFAGFSANGTIADGTTSTGVTVKVVYNTNCLTTDDTLKIGGLEDNDFCANIIYDVNGTKGPNMQGDDIGFLTVFGPRNPVVAAPVLVTSKEANKCVPTISMSPPSPKEAVSIFINKQIVKDITGNPQNIVVAGEVTDTAGTLGALGGRNLICVSR